MFSLFPSPRQPARMNKISNIFSFLIGVDQYGKVHAVKDSYELFLNLMGNEICLATGEMLQKLQNIY